MTDNSIIEIITHKFGKEKYEIDADLEEQLNKFDVTEEYKG